MPENGSETGKTLNTDPAKHPKHRNARIFATRFATSKRLGTVGCRPKRRIKEPTTHNNPVVCGCTFS